MSGIVLRTFRRSVGILPVAIAVVGCSPGNSSPSAGPSPSNSASAEVKARQQRTAAGPGQSVTAKDLQGMQVARAEELLVGRFAGVQVDRIAGGISVKIRGTSTFLGSNEPLYVIDGMHVTAGPGGALLGINPADIARIEVLKDISSTSMYGAQGANGVVVITLKDGR